MSFCLSRLDEKTMTVKTPKQSTQVWSLLPDPNLPYDTINQPNQTKSMSSHLCSYHKAMCLKKEKNVCYDAIFKTNSINYKFDLFILLFCTVLNLKKNCVCCLYFEKLLWAGYAIIWPRIRFRRCHVGRIVQLLQRLYLFLINIFGCLLESFFTDTQQWTGTAR